MGDNTSLCITKLFCRAPTRALLKHAKDVSLNLKDFQIQTLSIEIVIVVCHLFKDPIILARQKPEPDCKTVSKGTKEVR